MKNSELCRPFVLHKCSYLFQPSCWERKLQTCCNFNSLTKNCEHILCKNMSNVRQLQIKTGKIHIDWNEKYEKLITAALHSKAKIMQTLIFFYISKSMEKNAFFFPAFTRRRLRGPTPLLRLLPTHLAMQQAWQPRNTRTSAPLV